MNPVSPTNSPQKVVALDYEPLKGSADQGESGSASSPKFAEVVPYPAMITGAIFGAIIGYPLSWCFQDGQGWSLAHLEEYIWTIGSVLTHWDTVWTAAVTWLSSTVVCGSVGLAIGIKSSPRGRAWLKSTDDTMKVGTLKYTAAGLFWLFVWLLWGDFVFNMMEHVIPSILPFRLKDQLHAPDWVIPIILSTIPSTLNFILNPIISTASDRHRGRLGRRIPFMLYSAPFISGGLVLLAFSPEIGAALHKWVGPLTGWSLAAVGIATLGVLMATFRIFELFVATVFWYFFNDVVPTAFMNRFMGCFRTVAGIVNIVYNWYLFEHALTHMRLIFLGAAGLYLIGFTMMCVGIKEGKYPPPDRMGRNPLQAFGTYVTECLRHRIYWYFFIHNIFWNISFYAIASYGFYLNQSLGLDLKKIGRTLVYVNLVQLLFQIPVGIIADRIHPLRFMVWTKAVMLFVVPLNFIWLFYDFTPQHAYWIVIALGVVELPMMLIYDTIRIPMQMRLLPKSRYGQFCSFNAIISAGVGIGASVVVGLFMTWMRHLLPDAVWGKDFCYRMIPAWRMPLLCVSFALLLLMYRQWKLLGGAQHYKTPGFDEDRDNWTDRGFEVVTPAKSAGPVVSAVASPVDPLESQGAVGAGVNRP